jgi:hypothetical protein
MKTRIQSSFAMVSAMVSQPVLQVLTIFSFYIAFSFSSLAQSAFVLDLTNEGQFTIKSGTTVTVIGGFQNGGAANLLNNGDLAIRKDITNHQSGITPGTGRLILNGTEQQTIFGTQAFRTYHLSSDNAAGVYLSNDLVVYGVHSFVSGLITTPSNGQFLVYETGATYTGAQDNAHVYGWVKKNGTADFIFPVGNDRFLRPVSLSNLSQSTLFAVRHNGPTPNHTQVAAPVIAVNANEYWQIERTGGGRADITLNWDQSKIPMPFYYMADIRGTINRTNIWNAVGAGATGNVFTTGSIVLASQNQFGSFALGTIGYLVPLKYLLFKGERRTGYTRLNWETLYETTSEWHEVERSNDGVRFRKIGTVAAVNGMGVHQYVYNDATALQGRAWYRIRTIDRSGTASYSSIISVTENSGNDIVIVNNPVEDVIVLLPGAQISGSYNYQLVAANGQLIQQGRIQLSAGGTTPIRIEQNVSKGIYVLEIKNGLNRFTKTVMVR